MHHVFVSYSRRDMAFVDAVGAMLAAADVPLWTDRRDMPVSVPWLAELETAIEQSDLVLVFDSPAWRASKPCQVERQLAATAHKAMYLVDATAGPAAVQAVAGQILDAYRRLPPDLSVHTDIVAHAAIWERDGRSDPALIGGQLLARGSKLQRRGTPPLSPTAHDFLRAARRLQRRRRMLVATGASVTTLALVGCCLGGLVRSDQEQRIEQADTDFGNTLAAADAAANDPYRELAEARARVLSGNGGYLSRIRLTNALERKVPDDSYLVDAERLVGFTSRVVADQPSVVDTAGRTHRGRPVAGNEVGPESAPSGQPVLGLAASADGRTVVTRSAGAVAVRGSDGRSTELPAASTVAVSGDGRTVLRTSDAIATVHGPGSPREIPLPAGCCTATALAGGVALFGTERGELLAWSAADGLRSVWRRPDSGAVTRMAASADARRVAVTLAGDGVVHILTTPGFALERRTSVAGPGGPVAFGPGDRLLAMAVGDSVSLVDVVAGTTVARLEGSVGAITDLAWSPAGDRLWAVTAANRVSTWAIRAGTVIADDPSRWYESVVGPDRAGRLAVVARDGTVEVFDAGGGRAGEFKASVDKVTTAVLSRDGAALAIGGADRIVVTDLAGKETSRVSVECQPSGMAFDAAGLRLYVACGGPLLAFDRRTMAKVAEIKPGDFYAYSVTVADAGTIFAGGLYGQIYRFPSDLRSGTRLRIGDCAVIVRAVTVDPAATTVIMSGDGAGHFGCTFEGRLDGAAWAWTPNSHLRADAEQARALALAPGAAVAAIGFSDGTVRFWRPRELEVGGGYRHFGGEIRGVAFTVDGAHALVASRDGVIELLPACPMCDAMPELAARAGKVLGRARTLGLTTVAVD
jgi:WD40 repeat protein